uniref:DUF6010 family protein n=1 Tax=Ningiella ruwaisensis TaxID=2364274 RepID=UPI00109FBA63|nr:DUF6010 family protein [Ningiella ruwaisensis]
MISIFIGLVLSLLIIVFAKLTRFEQDLSFYPTLLIVIASYYVLFSVIAGHSILLEAFIALAFFGIAILGAYKSLVIVGLGIVVHGAYDIIHAVYLNNSVSPSWWPAFCATVDIVLGSWVIYSCKKGRLQLQAKKHKFM